MTFRIQALLLAVSFFAVSFAASPHVGQVQAQKKKPSRRVKKPIKPCEVSELLRLFSIPNQSDPVPRWDIGLGKESDPIAWLTDGVENTGDNDDIPRSDFYPSYREAKAALLVNGKEPWKLGRNRRIPILWDVYLLGHKGPSCLSIAMEVECFGSSNSGCDFDIRPSLKNSGFLILEDREVSGLIGENILLKVSKNGFHPLWVFQCTSGGSGGEVTNLSVFWSLEEAELAIDFDRSLSR